MQDRLDKVFYEDIREKKVTASGVHGKKGKKGHVGKMVTPADVSGREYRESKDLPSYNIYEFLHKLNEAPTLKSVLLTRMDEEYQNYRRAVEKTLDAVAELIRIGIEPLYQEMNSIQRQLERLACLHDAVEGDDDGPTFTPTPTSISGPVRGKKKRIRWGSDPETIRRTVFEQLRELTSDGEEISTETIKQRVPSMLRWIYGERAIFEGIEGLRREFLQNMQKDTGIAAPDLPQRNLNTGDVAGETEEREALQA